jgi:Zn-dependent oligopeptidase
LGYKNFATYALELCMAKNQDNVKKFLEDLSSKLRLLLENELDILLKYKKDEVSKILTIIVIQYFFDISVKDLKYHLMEK